MVARQRRAMGAYLRRSGFSRHTWATRFHFRGGRREVRPYAGRSRESKYLTNAALTSLEVRDICDWQTSHPREVGVGEHCGFRAGATAFTIGSLEVLFRSSRRHSMYSDTCQMPNTQARPSITVPSGRAS